MKPRMAFIGAGSIAQSHLDALRYAGAEVVGVCTRSSLGAEFAAKNNIADYASTPTELIERCQPDAVFLLTQPSAYANILESLQIYNLPLFMEKPLATTVREAESLKKLLPSKVFVGLNRRFYSTIKPILPMIQDEPPFMAQVIMPQLEKDYMQYKYKDPLICNHWYMLQGIHLIDLITYLTGSAQQVIGATQWGSLPVTTMAQYTMCLYETDRGHRVSFLCNFDSPGGWRIHLFLSKKEVIISPLEKTVIRTMSGFEELPVSGQDKIVKPGFIAQAECFLQGLKLYHLPKDWVSFDDALTSMKTLEILLQTEVTFNKIL